MMGNEVVSKDGAANARAHALMHDVTDALSLVTGHLTLLAESSGLDRDQRESVLTALEASNEAAEDLRELKRICQIIFPGSAS
jgi:hypothetical protein